MNKSHKQKRRRSREEWLEHMEQWQISGLTQRDYCQKNNINPCSFSAWKTKLEEETGTFSFVEINKPSLVDVEGTGNYIELILTTGRLRFNETIDPITLRNIVLALAGV